MRCILAATDGSESANRAVDAAAQIAKRFDAKLLIVNAIDRGVLSTDEMKRFTEVEGMLLGEALTSLSSEILRDAERQAKNHGLMNVQMESREGEAAQVVMEIVREKAVDAEASEATADLFLIMPTIGPIYHITWRSAAARLHD